MATRKTKMTDLFYGAGKQIRASGKRKAAPKAKAPAPRKLQPSSRLNALLRVEKKAFEASVRADTRMMRMEQSTKPGILSSSAYGRAEQTLFRTMDAYRSAKRRRENFQDSVPVAKLGKSTKLRSTVVRRKPNTAGLTRSKPKESTMATKKAKPKSGKTVRGSFKPKKRGPRTPVYATAGKFSKAVLGKMTQGALNKQAEALQAAAAAAPRGSQKAKTLFKGARATMDMYNSRVQKGSGKSIFNISANSKRTGASQG